MSYTKKLLSFLALSSTLLLAACGSNGGATSSSPTSSSSADSKDRVTVKLGVVGENNEVWDSVSKRLSEETNIDVKLVYFTDYVQPNIALDAGDLDLNSFQTQIYMENFNKDQGLSNVSVGYTVMAPLGIYSKKVTKIDELKEGAKVTIPDDVSNEGRALRLLQAAGLITVDASKGLLPTTDDITANPLKLDITPLASNQTARSLDDVDIAVINSGMAVDAGLTPTQDAIFLEAVNEDSKPYYNVIAAKDSRKDEEVFKTIVKYYQSDETAAVIKESSKGSSIPVWDGAPKQ